MRVAHDGDLKIYALIGVIPSGQRRAAQRAYHYNGKQRGGKAPEMVLLSHCFPPISSITVSAS